MAEPKEGYNSGVNRNISGTATSNGDFIETGVGQSFNREDTVTVDGTVEKFTWPEGSRPTKIIVTAHTPSVVGTLFWVAFDAIDGNGDPDDVLGAAWLAGATGVAVDSQRFIVFPVDPALAGATASNSGWQKEFAFTDGLSVMHYKSVGGTVIVHVEAS